MKSLWNRLSNLAVTKELRMPDGRVINNNRLVAITTSTFTVNAADHSDKPISLQLAAGITVTLPAATGSGAKFEFYVGITFTGSGIVKVANATDVMNGFALQSQDAGATLQMFEAALTDDTVTLNGTTTGGQIGDRIELVDLNAGVWAVRVMCAGTGTEATPFSATV